MSPTRTVALLAFTDLRTRAERLLRMAASLEHISDLHRAQATAAAGIAGNRFHTVHGEAGPDDARAIGEDLVALYGIVDPLILNIGREAAASFHGIDLAEFTDQVRGALEGNATYVLAQAAEMKAEALADAAAVTGRELEDA